MIYRAYFKGPRVHQFVGEGFRGDRTVRTQASSLQEAAEKRVAMLADPQEHEQVIMVSEEGFAEVFDISVRTEPRVTVKPA